MRRCEARSENEAIQRCPRSESFRRTLAGASGVITFNANGTYRVTVDVGLEELGTGGDRFHIAVTVQEDTGGGFTNISYAISSAYHRKTADKNSSSQSWMRTFNLGDDIRIRVIRTTGTATPLDIDTTANASRILIEKVD